MNVHDRVNIWRVGPHGGYSQLLGSGPSAASDQRGSYLVLTPVRMDENPVMKIPSAVGITLVVDETVLNGA